MRALRGTGKGSAVCGVSRMDLEGRRGFLWRLLCPYVGWSGEAHLEGSVPHLEVAWYAGE